MSAVVVNGSDFNSTDLQIGLNTESNFDYGEIPAGVKVTKSFSVNTTTDVLMQMDITGNISEKIDYQKTYYFNGSKDIPVAFNSSDTGYFTGKLELTTSKPANSMGEKWLEIKSSLYS